MIKNKKTADHYTWGEGCDGWRLLDCADLTVTEERMPPGESEINHSHGRSRQLFFVLQGQIQIDLDGKVVRLKTGDAIEVAPRKPHRVRNASKRPASLLVISSPSTVTDREEHEPLRPKRRR